MSSSADEFKKIFTWVWPPQRPPTLIGEIRMWDDGTADYVQIFTRHAEHAGTLRLPLGDGERLLARLLRDDPAEKDATP